MKITIDVDPKIIEDIWTHSYMQSSNNYNTVIDAVCKEYNKSKEPEPYTCRSGTKFRIDSKDFGSGMTYGLVNMEFRKDHPYYWRIGMGPKLQHIEDLRDYLTNYINWAKITQGKE